LAKLLPAPLLVALLPLLSAGLGVGAATWIAHAERRNLRDRDGFRAVLQRRTVFRGMLSIVIILLIVAAVRWFDVLWRPPHPTIPLTLAGLVVILSLGSIRVLQLNRTKEAVVQVAGMRFATFTSSARSSWINPHGCCVFGQCVLSRRAYGVDQAAALRLQPVPPLLATS
jgi:hypothetical protein